MCEIRPGIEVRRALLKRLVALQWWAGHITKVQSGLRWRARKGRRKRFVVSHVCVYGQLPENGEACRWLLIVGCSSAFLILDSQGSYWPLITFPHQPNEYHFNELQRCRFNRSILSQYNKGYFLTCHLCRTAGHKPVNSC